MVMSVVTNEIGTTLGSNVLVTTDRSPVETRWGGWYVTGSGNNVPHAGNVYLSEGNSARQLDASAQLAAITDELDYPDSGSDAVALLLLAHQSEIHNLIGEATFAVRAILDGVEPAGRDLNDREMERIGEVVEPLVRGMLFVDAAPPGGAGNANSQYAREFVQMGPEDSRGRSLRELDLDERLLRHSMSHLIYTDGFDGMPERARDYAYGRFLDIFEGREESAAFAHLTASDRRTLMEILTETKPSFRDFVAAR
jgi:hypothetical protein